MTKADFNRSWGIDPKRALRYNGVKGVYWHYFSIHVRKRDFMQYGRCISCNKKVEDWKLCDAGHFVAASRSRKLQFHPQNVNLQCKFCNGPYNSKASGAGYAVNLDKRYGAGTAAKLWEMKEGISHEMPDEWFLVKLGELGVTQKEIV